MNTLKETWHFTVLFTFYLTCPLQEMRHTFKRAAPSCTVKSITLYSKWVPFFPRKSWRHAQWKWLWSRVCAENWMTGCFEPSDIFFVRPSVIAPCWPVTEKRWIRRQDMEYGWKDDESKRRETSEWLETVFQPDKNESAVQLVWKRPIGWWHTGFVVSLENSAQPPREGETWDFTALISCHWLWLSCCELGWLWDLHVTYRWWLIV